MLGCSVGARGTGSVRSPRRNSSYSYAWPRKASCSDDIHRRRLHQAGHGKSVQCGKSGSNKIQKSKHACIVETYEYKLVHKIAVTQRFLVGKGTLLQDHQDHIAEKGFHSLCHYNLVHKFISVPQAMKIPDAKAAVDKEWEKLGILLSWQMTKSQEQKMGHQMGTEKKGGEFI